MNSAAVSGGYVTLVLPAFVACCDDRASVGRMWWGRVMRAGDVSVNTVKSFLKSNEIYNKRLLEF